MFVSDTHLPQLLPASAYHDDDWYQRERKLVFHPAWWAVALMPASRWRIMFVPRS